MVLVFINGDNVYEGYLYFVEVGEFKFVFGGWDMNWGDIGVDGMLDLGGDNFLVVDFGLYQVKVNIDDLIYSVIKIDWGIIGFFILGGWDSDMDMIYNVEIGIVEIIIELVVGEIKFCVNDDWGLNYGDIGVDVIMDEGGDNIVIDFDGLYIIKLFLDCLDYIYFIECLSFDSWVLFYVDGQIFEIFDIFQFMEGYVIIKWKNINVDGLVGFDLIFLDIDFFMFCLVDVYLMYVEVVLRGGLGSILIVVEYVNRVLIRVYGDVFGNIVQVDLSFDFILDECVRELVWECY